MFSCTRVMAIRRATNIFLEKEDAQRVCLASKLKLCNSSVRFQKWRPASSTIKADWCSKNDRWVTLVGLPVHLRKQEVMVSLVFPFGSMLNEDPNQQRDGKVDTARVLVGHCELTKVPRIISIMDEGVMFPVRVISDLQDIHLGMNYAEGRDLEEMKSSRGEAGRRRHHKDSEKRSTGSDMIAEVSQNYKKDVSFQAKGKEHWNITKSNSDNEGEKTHVHHKKQKLLADVVRAEGVGGTGAINAAITIQQIEPGEDQIYLLKPQQKQQSKNLSVKSKVGINATRIIGQCALYSAVHSFNLEAAGPTLDNDNDNSKLDASHQSYLKMLTSPARIHFSKVTAGGGVKDKGKTKEDHGAEADSSVNSSLRFDQPVLPMFYPHQVKSVSSGISIGMESQEMELYLSTAQSQLSLVSKSGTLSQSAEKPGTAVHETKQTAWRKEPKQEWVKSPVVYKRRRMSKLEGQGKDDFIVQSDRANGSDVSDPQETSEAIGEKVMGDLGLSALK